MNAGLVTELLDELEESLGVQGYLGLYEFMWTARGLPGPPSSEDLQLIVHAAYDELRRHRPMRLVWARWPIDVGDAWPAEPGTKLDFDMDPDDPVETPILVLAPEA